MSKDAVHAHQKRLDLQKLVGDELDIVATFLLRLMEFDRDRLHETLGYASLWDFCRRGLGLCESTAGRRLKAIKVLARIPIAVDYLRDGRLCVTRLLLLAEVLTAENASSILERASRKSLRDIELLAASECPRPAPPARVQRFPEPRPTPEAPTLDFGSPTDREDSAAPEPAQPTVQAEPDPVKAPSPEPEPTPTPLPRARRRPTIHPTSDQEYSARFPVSREWVGKLDLAKKLGSHVVRNGDPVAILELALDLFIEKYGKRRGAIAPKAPRAKRASVETVPRPAESTSSEPPKKDRFTAEDRREIWQKSGGHCVWPMDSGDVCGSEWQLEVDHIDPKAKGGATEPGSARLLCREHNDQHARETYGEAFMQAKKGGGNKSCLQ